MTFPRKPFPNNPRRERERLELESLGQLIEARRYILRREEPPPCAWYTKSAFFVVFPIIVPKLQTGPNMQQIPRERR